ncbi:protocatechuate 4,5-dioxygenase beta chain/2,3-dihydroxyphenylpropionate 1,2-dioxygenase [Maritimibacter alkaliphilus HTCC2654]|uniref:Possible 2,3-dihydroxyphenylpropionate 1,2-dioxygenase n=1 Tax=Maritimibacter alkaliphilus HTCC2654 TaxID=314271 RepID=A3VDM1_9RHOB|nr:2,3-dihydroxyphenylpropionate 1,2-dioxygenase [Maritimibacter alkaliphilus]EAQ13610.1 possible 2,3-dihydroxyphenylpropionate 1,2-dioxygenase [Maritimibacter alkaliphilus HTCC2654]TYP83449.1 protocatechuate 4,5-dioxygenase beta chain/2,3-dihydroxyphenylpropionate 1,2-dioxygenase [Maritimibacter alkaliphilus HTCC2654]
MAEITGIYTASHTPVMLNFPDSIPAALKDEIFAAYKAMGDDFMAGKPDALIVLSNDHLHNFFLDNFPAYCIGCAESYESPIEHWLHATRRTFAGDQAFGSYLLKNALEAEFDPSFSMEMVLDHGSLTPLELAGVDPDLPIVPVLINCVQPPMPTMRRSYNLGKFLGQAIANYDGVDRVAILATGGISHDIATPRMGMVNEEFDQTFLAHMESGDVDATIQYATDFVHTAGNGCEEIRMWMAAMGAANGATYERTYYKAVNDWYTGIGIGRFKVS